MDGNMKKLECPFTWAIDKTLEFDELDELAVDIDEEPLYAFITTITTAYFDAGNDNHKAVQKLKTLEDYWVKLDESQLNSFGVSTKVLFHIKEATKYYIYKEIDEKLKANGILENLEDAVEFQNAIELATISGCKSVVWSSFHEKAHQRVTELARVATVDSPNCPLWHYILAKGLRHSRHDDYGIEQPLDEEVESIVRSCQLSDKLFYKIRLAQMYTEQKEFDEAKAIFLDIYEADPNGQEILLRLARAFTSFRDFEKAEKCFDKVEGYPTNTMYHHYKGIFCIKTKQFEKAVLHFQEATKGGNYRGDLLYAWSMAKVNNSFNYIAYLKSLLEKYSKVPKYQQQTLLHIAMHYHYKEKDLNNTSAYLLKAIEFDPKSRQLQEYTNTTINWDILNVYDFTYENLQNFQNRAKSIKQMQDTVKKLRNYCEEYKKNKSQSWLFDSVSNN